MKSILRTYLFMGMGLKAEIKAGRKDTTDVVD